MAAPRFALGRDYLSIRSKAPAAYVHLCDPRAAGLEPGAVVSGYRWNLGIAWYEETRDSGTNFFFEDLPAGEYTLKYRLRANMAGTFRTGPATLQSMYAPEFTAYSTGTVIRVGEGSRKGAPGIPSPAFAGFQPSPGWPVGLWADKPPCP